MRQCGYLSVRGAKSRDEFRAELGSWVSRQFLLSQPSTVLLVSRSSSTSTTRHRLIAFAMHMPKGHHFLIGVDRDQASLRWTMEGKTA